MNTRELTKQLKLEMVRYCVIWNLGYEATKSYFKSQGYHLSKPRWVQLKREIDSDDEIKNWFSELALKAMEKDHKLTVQQYNELEKILLKEIHQLSMTSPYLLEDGEMIENKLHDTNKLTRAIQTFDLIKKSKSDVLVANPVVQAIMIKHEKELNLAQQKAQLADLTNGIPLPTGN